MELTPNSFSLLVDGFVPDSDQYWQYYHNKVVVKTSKDAADADSFWLPRKFYVPTPHITDLDDDWAERNVNVKCSLFLKFVASYKKHPFFTDRQALKLARSGMKQMDREGIAHCPKCCFMLHYFEVSRHTKDNDIMREHAIKNPTCAFVVGTGCDVPEVVTRLSTLHQMWFDESV